MSLKETGAGDPQLSQHLMCSSQTQQHTHTQSHTVTHGASHSHNDAVMQLFTQGVT